MILPTTVPITKDTFWYLGGVVAALVFVTVLVTRVFYVRKLAALKSDLEGCTKQKAALQAQMTQGPTRTADPVANQRGLGSQLTAILVAVGGLAGLVAATGPIITTFLSADVKKTQGQLEEQKGIVKRLQDLLLFDEGDWRAAAYRPLQPSSKDQPIQLANTTIDNWNLKTLCTFLYDGSRPAIIESKDSVVMVKIVTSGHSGVKLLVRPIDRKQANQQP